MKSFAIEPAFQKIAGALIPRRLRAHALILAIGVWSVIGFDFATPGFFDRAGNIKFQDFLPLYLSGKLIHEGRVNQLYLPEAATAAVHAIIPQNRVVLPFLYGPQVAWFFSGFTRLPFFLAAVLWVATSTLAYFACCHLVWTACPNLHRYRGLIWLAALAFPPFFHFVVRGQIAVLVLLCWVAAFFAFRSGYDLLAGLALGTLVFKPQFLLAIPLVLLLAGAWRSFAGTVIAAIGQLAAAWLCFGSTVMRAYIHMLWQLPGNLALVEPASSQAQMHSLRSFWTLLVPWGRMPLALYLASALPVLALTVLAWRRPGPLPLRFSLLVSAAVLVNPHLFVYDLLVLAPVLLLLADWVLGHPGHPAAARLSVLLYLAYLLPLLGPLTLITRLQLSVIALVALHCTLFVILRSQVPPLRANLRATV